MQIIDNVNAVWGDDLKANLKAGAKLKIAASCFSIYAYEALREELEKIDSLEFIFTSTTFVPEDIDTRKAREHREFYIPKLGRERSLYGSGFEILLRNKLTQRAIARECADWIKRKATFKSNTSRASMQQFAHMESGEGAAVYMPLHGFTAVDLGYRQGDAVSNFINRLDDASSTQTYLELYKQIWNDESRLRDITGIICSHIESVYRENTPEKIYFLMLYNIFNEFLEDLNEDVLPNDLTGYRDSVVWKKLFHFQRDAATGIINKLERFNGCILADSVGLGKTFSALAVIKYYELRNKSVLVLCPKKLADNWQTYRSNYVNNILADDRLSYDLLLHTDLSRERGKSMGIDLAKVNWGNYDLIVIDESHNFRNAGRSLKDKETRYERLLNAAIKAGVKTKVLMLSATPVNNRFNDLKSQLALAYEGESENLRKKVGVRKSIEDIFRQAQTTFNAWTKLPPVERTAQAILEDLDFDFFELLDNVTIARSRRHIETFYDITDIGPFPQRRQPLSFRLPITDRKDVIAINDVYTHLGEIKQALYAPMNYVLESRKKKYEDIYGTETHTTRFKQADRERALQNLMTTNLLKRLESSVAAFRITIKRMEEQIQNALEQINEYERNGKSTAAFVPTSGDSDDMDDDEEFENPDISTAGKVRIDFGDMDLVSWRRDLDTDHTLFLLLREEMEKITPEHDTKLRHLSDQLAGKIEHPINPGNRKVLVFTAFADTAEYLYDRLKAELTAKGIHIGKITGSSMPHTTLGRGFDFSRILTFFSPKSRDRKLIFPDEDGEIDVLVATDCISEGQNLQDCDYLINYDIHWNPVRIIQRFGRIDRIGSPNESVQLVNYWPDISLDEYIRLKERVENRMVMVDVTATGDDNILSAEANDISYRREQLRRLQDEVIELEDLKTGVSITDMGLNDFRMDLLNFIRDNGELDHLPNGLHAVIPSDSSPGMEPGVIFALRNRNSGININRHNRLHPYYLIYIRNDGEVIIDHTRAKPLLDLVRNSCKGRDVPIEALCRAFNAETEDGRRMDPYSNLLGRAIRSMISTEEDKDIDSLFTGTRTTALENAIPGLDDFELICFLIVKEKQA